jgi:hypothetical protein
MKFLAPAFASIFLLSGCSAADWDGAMRTVGMGEEAPPEVVSAAPVTAAPAPAPDNSQFCQSVARQQLQRQSYDPATQQEVMRRSFQQCMALHGEPR